MYQSYHSDIRGSTTVLTNEQGLVTDRYAYGTYGEVEHFEGNTSQPFQYNGRDGVMHDVNGLYYMRARYYHSELKRFLNRDVIRGDITEGQTFNRYAYVNGDPVRYVDPLGLARLECEVFEEAKIARTGEDWNEYFKKKYEDVDVEWVTGSSGYSGQRTVTSNKGNTYDATPFENHFTTTSVPHPAKGEPNSSVDILDKKTGEVKTTRYYDSNGRAIRDIDHTNHGNAKEHPEWPHEHTFKWNIDGTFKRIP